MAQSTSLALDSQTGAVSPTLKPLPLWQALVYFGVPAILIRLSVYNGTPVLLGLGLTGFEAFVVTFAVPLATMFAFALAFFKGEGHPLTWAALAERFRLKRMTGKDWLWTVAGFGLGFVGSGLLGVTARLILAALPALNPPGYFPAFLNPNVSLTPEVFAQFVGAPLRGNWGVALLYFVVLFFNIIGEELWWRGLILPRQELTHGRWTWFVHGVLWTLFHVPLYPWQIVALLPICLTIAFVSQKRQNNVPAIIIHYASNGMFFLFVVAMVVGLV